MFAHPDDDTWGLGGTYAASGDLDLTVVVATSGEAGLIADPALATRENLAEVREAEERASLAAVGQEGAAIHFLRFPDGGVAQADRAELVARIAEILRAARPEVVVTFGPEGTTKHDDHIAVSQAATEAFHEARGGAGGRRVRRGDAGLRRLFYVGIPQSELDGWFEMMRARGEEVDPDAPFMPRGESRTTRSRRAWTRRRTWTGNGRRCRPTPRRPTRCRRCPTRNARRPSPPSASSRCGPRSPTPARRSRTACFQGL